MRIKQTNLVSINRMATTEQESIFSCSFDTTIQSLKKRFFFPLIAVSILVIILGTSFIRVELNVRQLNTSDETTLVEFTRAPTLASTSQRNHEFTKPFIYLTQTKQCLPPIKASSDQIGDPETCNCDVIVLSYQQECHEQNNSSRISYLFDNTTSWATGRNLLYFAAIKRRPGYHYYIFIDDDTSLEFNKHTPPEMKKLRPFRAFEEWLLDYEPALGVVNYWRISAHQGFNRRKSLCGITENKPLVIPTVWFDGCINAYHYKAVSHVLPYPTIDRRKSWYIPNRHIMSAVELKFPGQAMMFVPVTIGNFGHSKYPKGFEEIGAYWRQFIDKIREEAPLAYRNSSRWEEFKKNLNRYMDTSPSHCMNATRHLPIVPFAHFERGTS